MPSRYIVDLTWKFQYRWVSDYSARNSETYSMFSFSCARKEYFHVVDWATFRIILPVHEIRLAIWEISIVIMTVNLRRLDSWTSFQSLNCSCRNTRDTGNLCSYMSTSYTLDIINLCLCSSQIYPYSLPWNAIIALIQSNRMLLNFPTPMMQLYDAFLDTSDIFDNYISPNSYFIFNFLADSF